MFIQRNYLINALQVRSYNYQVIAGQRWRGRKYTETQEPGMEHVHARSTLDSQQVK